jgi:hypothetical protein
LRVEVKGEEGELPCRGNELNDRSNKQWAHDKEPCEVIPPTSSQSSNDIMILQMHIPKFCKMNLSMGIEIFIFIFIFILYLFIYLYK